VHTIGVRSPKGLDKLQEYFDSSNTNFIRTEGLVMFVGKLLAAGGFEEAPQFCAQHKLSNLF
jgi:hypothetical protein